MPASRAASSRGMPSSALASASRRALTHPSRSRRARRRSSAASRSVRIGKGAGMAASPKTMPPQRLKSASDPSPLQGGGIMRQDDQLAVKVVELADVGAVAEVLAVGHVAEVVILATG